MQKSFICILKISAGMKSKYLICLALAALAFTMIAGCVAEEKTVSSYIPAKDLPSEFRLLAIKDNTTPGVNMTDEISDFYGSRSIGQVEAAKGIYVWGTMGVDYDAVVTVIKCQDEEHAKVAVSNYRSLPRFEKPPFEGVDRFSTASINGHDVLEIRKGVNDKALRFLYLWNNKNMVVLVEGNSDRGASQNLGKETGL